MHTLAIVCLTIKSSDSAVCLSSFQRICFARLIFKLDFWSTHCNHFNFKLSQYYAHMVFRGWGETTTLTSPLFTICSILSMRSFVLWWGTRISNTWFCWNNVETSTTMNNSTDQLSGTCFSIVDEAFAIDWAQRANWSLQYPNQLFRPRQNCVQPSDKMMLM